MKPRRALPGDVGTILLGRGRIRERRLLAALSALLVVVTSCAPVALGLPNDFGVAPRALEVGIHASATTGTAPLPVQFVAVILGGTGVYPSVVWTLGPAATAVGTEVNYTFQGTCTCSVSVNVTDSSGDRAGASLSVLVAAPVAVRSTHAPPASWPLSILASGGMAGLVVGLASWTLQGDRRTATPPAGRRTGLAVASRPDGPNAGPVRLDGPATAPAPANPKLAAETLRLSERVIVYLARQPALGPYDVAAPSRTQAGISQRFGASQSAVSNVLARLTAAQVVVALTRHVEGERRRRKVYLLTPYGEELAKGLAAKRVEGVRPPSGLLPPVK